MFNKTLANPVISLILVTYNAEEFIIDCLISVQGQSYTFFETIIVDNASTDKTTDIIETNFPWVKLIKSEINLGFACGVNLGYAHSKGEFIALLNPDAKADRNWLGNLISAINANTKCGICASLMLKWGTQIVDTAGDGCTRAGKGYKIGHNQPADRFSESRDVFTACGGAALYRRSMIEEIGFFDPDFFLLHEDTDLGFRARLAGWNCRYVHDAVVEHKVSASIGYKSSLAVYHSVKNSDQVWLKNMPIWLLLLSFPEKLLSDVASLIYLGIIHKRLNEYLKAKKYILKNIFKIIVKRRDVQDKKAIGSIQLFKMITPFFSFKYLFGLSKEKVQELKMFNNM